MEVSHQQIKNYKKDYHYKNLISINKARLIMIIILNQAI